MTIQASLTELVEVAYRHAAAEGAGDLAGTLATLEDEPVYELYPAGLRLVGMDRTRRYYEHFFAEVAGRTVDYQMLTEWVGAPGLAQEYEIWLRRDDGSIGQFRVFSILKFGRTLLSGERLYADDEFFRILFGPLWAELEPINAGAQ